MSSHPARSRGTYSVPPPKNFGAWVEDALKGKSPSPEQLRALRGAMRLTQAQIAAKVGKGLRWYEECESGRSAMHPNDWYTLRSVGYVEIARGES